MSRRVPEKANHEIIKQLLLVLLFILSCILLSRGLYTTNGVSDSGASVQSGIFEIGNTDDLKEGAVYFKDDWIFVPNIDYEDIDSGDFEFYDYLNLPYASGVSITHGGWSDGGENVVWHNCTDVPEFRAINRNDKTKECAAYIAEFRFEDPDRTYYLSIPELNGLPWIYCNGNSLGSLWGRTDEWTPTFGYGFGYVPIIPDSNGTARVIITISTNVLIKNPGILAAPFITDSANATKFVVFPALWYMLQIILTLFVIVGGALVSRTFKSRNKYFLFILINLLYLAFTAVDCHIITFDAYTKELSKYLLYVFINLASYFFMNALFAEEEGKDRKFYSGILSIVVLLAGLGATMTATVAKHQFDFVFPISVEVLLTVMIALITYVRLIAFHYHDKASFNITLFIVFYIFFCANSIIYTRGIFNIPAYSVFFVIGIIILELYFTYDYVSKAKKLEDTMEHMQFLVQEKTLRISEINRDLYNTNKKLMENEQARKNVLSNVSHDLRTPITAIRGYAELILTAGPSMADENRKNYLLNIIRRSQQMERIISDIVELTRLESNANEFQFTDVSLCELLDEICMMYEADLENTKKKITLEIPDDDPLLVKADPKKLSRVFENLISNAINYTFEEAEIRVSAWREGKDLDVASQTVCIDVRDNGIGIPENEIPMVFDRFYRAKNSGQNIKGTGIGLSIVKTIIDRHGASITVESTIGSGTVFHIVMKAAY